MQGVVTAAVSLIETLAKKNSDDYKGCVSLAVSRLSRVSHMKHVAPVGQSNLRFLSGYGNQHYSGCKMISYSLEFCRQRNEF